MKDFNNLKIGNILYVLKDRNIIPVQIAEIITRQRLSGKETIYLVYNPKSDFENEKPVNLLKLKGEDGKIFENLEDLKEEMFKNATNAINNLISRTNEIVLKKFNVENEAQFEDEFPFEGNDEKNDKEKLQNKEQQIARIVLDDGSVAKVNM